MIEKQTDAQQPLAFPASTYLYSGVDYAALSPAHAAFVEERSRLLEAYNRESNQLFQQVEQQIEQGRAAGQSIPDLVACYDVPHRKISERYALQIQGLHKQYRVPVLHECKYALEQGSATRFHETSKRYPGKRQAFLIKQDDGRVTITFSEEITLPASEVESYIVSWRGCYGAWEVCDPPGSAADVNGS